MDTNEKHYELKLSSGKIVKWNGTSGINAAMRYVDCNPGECVIAWREVQHDLYIGIHRIIE